MSKKSFSWLFEIPLHFRDHLGLLFTSSECISAKLGRWSCHFLNAFFKATFSESAASPLLLSSLLSLSSSPSPCKTFVISGSLKTNHILLDSKCGCLEEQPKNLYRYLWEAIYSENLYRYLWEAIYSMKSIWEPATAHLGEQPSPYVFVLSPCILVEEWSHRNTCLLTKHRTSMFCQQTTTTSIRSLNAS